MKPLVNPNTKILVMGTFPGVQTLKNNSNDAIVRRVNFLERNQEKKAPEYYSDKRNLFWGMLLGEKKDIKYEEKLKLLDKNNIGLWDIFKYTEREGSLDNNINLEKSTFNAIYSLLQLLPNLKEIVFNGDKSFDFFKKYLKVNNLIELLEKKEDKYFFNIIIGNGLVRKIKINTIYSTSGLSQTKVTKENRIKRLEKTGLKKFIKNI